MDFKISRKLLNLLHEDLEIRRHFEIMKKVLFFLQKRPLFFKGGSAIMFFYESDRFSEDLDFDVYIKPEIFSVKKIADELSEVLKIETNIVKDTEITKRLKVKVPDLSKGIKIEFSFRNYLKDKGLRNYREGLRVYTIDEIARMKLKALKGRIAGRDLYDIAFIIDVWKKELSLDTLKTILKLFEEKTIEEWMESFEQIFIEDPRLGEAGFYLTYSRLLGGIPRIKVFLNQKKRSKSI